MSVDFTPRTERSPTYEGTRRSRYVELLVRPLSSRSRALLLVLTFALVLVVGVIDFFTGPQLSFSIFYVVPIGVAAWIGGRKGAAWAAVLSTVALVAADLLGAAQHRALSVVFGTDIFRVVVFVLIAALLSELRVLLEAERDLALLDPLTGVANVRRFAELAEAEIYRARRYGRPLSVAFIDVDDFKRINTEIGHTGGDAVLRAIATQIRSTTRASDTVARLGGDEFVVLFPETGAAAAERLLVRLAERLGSVGVWSGRPVSLSIGLATFATAPSGVDQIIEWSDRLMYEAKEAGKDRLVHHVVGGEQLSRQDQEPGG
jgi:diguanylate cyclase (GGDEF)-like protein